MSIWELVARERARIVRLLIAGTALRALAVLAFVLLGGAIALGGSRWMTLPRVAPFVVWIAAVALATWMARFGSRAARRAADPLAIADVVEREQQLRRGAVRGLVELRDHGSVFVRLASQRLGAELAKAGTSLAPEFERALRRAGSGVAHRFGASAPASA